MPLHPQAREFVESLKAAPGPDWHELQPAKAREVFSGLMDIFGPSEAVAAVEDLTIPGQAATARLYRPTTAGDLPVIMYFHGGGWVLGSVETHDALCRRLANTSQCAVVSVDYSLSPEARYPLAVDQCCAGLACIAATGRKWGLMTDRLALAGDSAGGNLAAAVALRCRDEERFSTALRAQALIYPAADPTCDSASCREFAEGFGLTRVSVKWFWEQYLGQLDRPAPYADLTACDLHNLPETLVLTAEYDILRDEGEALAKRLQAAGVPTQLKRYDGMLHGFVHFSGLFDTAREALNDVAEFLQTRLR